MKVKKTLAEILKDQTITNQFDFSGSCPDQDGDIQTFEIFKTAFFLMEVMTNYCNRSALVDEDNPFADLVSIFTLWKYTRGSMYARIAYAYSLGYNPIENYNSVETHTGYDELEHGKSTERAFDKYKIERSYNQDKVERTYNQDKVERTYNQDKVERTYNQDAIATTHANDKATTTYTNLKDEAKKYGVNSASAVPVSENVRNGSEDIEYSGTRTDTHSGGYDDEHTGGYDDEHTGGYDDTHSGGYDDETSGKYTDTDSGSDTQNYNSTISKHGNIGVSTVAGMTAELFDGLSQDLQNRALKEFLDRYTFYAEGVSLW